MTEQTPSRILLAEDSESVRKQITRLLTLRGWQVTAASSVDEALSQIRDQEFDVVALDLVMPGESSLAALQQIRGSDAETCIVMLSGEGDLDRAMECAEAGADDFIEKASFEPLQGLDFRLRRAHASRLLEVERHRMAEELRTANEDLQQANAELERISHTDQLTGLFNRRRIEQRLREEISRNARYDRHLGVGLLDLDHFKTINDTYGHPVGDQVLAEFALMLTQTVRTTDVPGRYGGEEFLVLFPETDAPGVQVCLERLRRAVDQTKIGPAEMSHRVTVSCGGTAAVPEGRDADSDITSLVAKADEALYQAKESGRNRVVMLPSDR